MSIFTAKLISGTAQHVEFLSRNIPGLTQARMSEVPIHGKPDMTELAYAGYKQNIDVFIAASLSNTTINCDHILPIPPKVPISIDLPLPSIAFTFKKVLTADQMKKFEKATEDYQFEEMVLDKANTVFVLKQVPFSFILDKLRHVANPTCKLPEMHCSVESAVASYLLYAGVQGFLATNSYPFSRFHGEDEEDEEMTQDDPEDVGVTYYNISSKRFTEELVGSSKKARVSPEAQAQEGDEGEIDVDFGTPPAAEENDETENGTIFMNIGPRSEVYKAKPSPLPYNINCGRPSDIPNLPGTLFPYFHGLLAADTSFVRSTALDLFFRMMGTEETSCREGYKEFRAAIVSFCYTIAGHAMSHVLKGISLALETQTQLFLMLEQGTYLGFCLLGGQYHIFKNAQWVPPRTRSELKTDIGTIWSHDTTLTEILAFLNARQMTSNRGPTQAKYKMKDVEKPVLLARCIGKIVWAVGADEKVAEQSELTDMLTHLSFENRYFAINSVRRIVQLIEDLSLPNLQARFDDYPFFFSQHYHLYGNGDFRLLSAFGSQAPSPFSISGDTFKIAQPDSKDPASEVSETTKKKKMHSFILAWKPIHVAHGDWVRVMDKLEVRFPLNERAKESRCSVFTDKARDEIWGAMIKFIGPKGKDKETEAETSKKVSAFMPAETADFDDLF